MSKKATSKKKKNQIIIWVLAIAIIFNFFVIFSSPMPIWPILTMIFAAGALIIYYRE